MVWRREVDRDLGEASVESNELLGSPGMPTLVEDTKSRYLDR